jgi:hypothetical protein
MIPDVLVFGDSVMDRVAREDMDRRSLAEMVSVDLGQELRSEVFSFSAFHSEVFAALLGAVAQLEVCPRCIVLPVNLRSFSPQWSCNPEFRFAEEINLAGRFAAGELNDDPMVSRGQDGKHVPADVVEWRRYQDVPVDFPWTPFRKVGDFLRLIASSPRDEDEAGRRKQAIFTFHYMNELEEGDEKLKALLVAVKTALGMGSSLVLYVTPINRQAGMQFVGGEFGERVARNVGLIKELFDRLVDDRKASFLDLSGALGRSMFFDDDTATEHLNQAGRRYVSAEVCGAVRQLLFGDEVEFNTTG